MSDNITDRDKLNYQWTKCADELPDVAVIVWASIGGGTAILARFNHYRWESATNNRPLPFTPIYWQHLRLPDSPGPLTVQI